MAIVVVGIYSTDLIEPRDSTSWIRMYVLKIQSRMRLIITGNTSRLSRVVYIKQATNHLGTVKAVLFVLYHPNSGV